MNVMSATDAPRNGNHPRYSRQLVLKGFGIAAQERLAGARVLVVGAGGLGSPVAMYLAATGVGTLTLVDADAVDVTNLHRQLLYGTADVGRPKLDAARARLEDINPLVTIVTRDTRLNSANAATLAEGHDIVVDATDNFPARYAINDACLTHGIPFVYGSVARFQGQVSVFAHADGPCYRCLFPEPPAPGTVPTCAEEGVLGLVPGIVGLHQANEAIKLLVGIGTPLVGRLMLLDLLENDSQVIDVHRRADCPACAARDARRGAVSDTTLPVNQSSSKAHVNNPISFSTPVQQLSPRELAERLAGESKPTLLDVREQWEYDIAHLPNSRLVPLSELQMTVATLNKNDDFVVMCHSGMRSEMAAQWMQAQGFSRVANLAGGIEAWSLTVDPSIPRY